MGQAARAQIPEDPESQLKYSLSFNKWDKVIEILEANPELQNLRDQSGENPVHRVLTAAPPERALEFLEKFPTTVSLINRLGHTAIHEAVFRQNEAVVLKVLEIDTQAARRADKSGNWPLHHCAFGNFPKSCTPRVLEALYRAAPEALTTPGENQENPIQRAHNSPLRTAPILRQFLELDFEHSLDALPSLPEVAPIMGDESDRDFVLNRLELYFQTSSVDLRADDFDWELFFSSLALISEREDRGPLLGRWNDRSLMQAIEIFTHTAATYEAQVHLHLNAVLDDYRSPPLPYNLKASYDAVNGIFDNYARFLANMVSTQIDTKALERGDASILNLIYLYRSNIKKHALKNPMRQALFDTFIAYLAAKPELTSAIVELDVLYHQGNREEILRRFSLYEKILFRGPSAK
ncbi:MAG TPA: hypothetical protein VM901_08110 [Bdellovibrionota bacterium]|nr:hypothetical protein [Bdellovibrionota bacterium]